MLKKVGDYTYASYAVSKNNAVTAFVDFRTTIRGWLECSLHLASCEASGVARLKRHSEGNINRSVRKAAADASMGELIEWQEAEYDMVEELRRPSTSPWDVCLVNAGFEVKLLIELGH